MKVSKKQEKLTNQQQRVLKLLFKFRFTSSTLLALVMGIRRVSAYQVLEYLVNKGLVTKVYKDEFRIDRKPAYYYLSKTGATTVRKLMDVKESVVHTLYKNAEASEEFIEHSLKATLIYTTLAHSLPDDTDIFTRTELNRFKQFPKNRPDLYIRTSDGKEAIIILADDKPPYIIRKRLDEIIAHNEDEGWDGDYPCIYFVLKDESSKNSFLYTTRKKLENMGFDDDEICIFAASLKDLEKDVRLVWSNALNPKRYVSLFE